MIKLLATTAALAAALIMPQAASAACSCMCVNNNKQWVCANSWDVPAGFCSGYCSGNSDTPRLEVPDQASIKLLDSISHRTGKKEG